MPFGPQLATALDVEGADATVVAARHHRLAANLRRLGQHAGQRLFPHDLAGIKVGRNQLALVVAGKNQLVGDGDAGAELLLEVEPAALATVQHVDGADLAIATGHPQQALVVERREQAALRRRHAGLPLHFQRALLRKRLQRGRFETDRTFKPAGTTAQQRQNKGGTNETSLHDQFPRESSLVWIKSRKVASGDALASAAL
ncbi:hypothetical protein D3C85_1311690 [compost metagenome]